MTKEQEAQQEQTIAEICGRVKTGSGKWAIGVGQWINDVEMLLDIVDSRAQKIAEQAKEIEKLRKWLGAQDLDAMIARELMP